MRGNQYARKAPRSAFAILLDDYQDIPEANRWLHEHQLSLDSLTFVDEKRIDRASAGTPSGFPREVIAELRLELRLGLCTPPAHDIVEDNEDLSTAGPEDLGNLAFPWEVCR